jgi:ABC-type methionine transport system permease subunit
MKIVLHCCVLFYAAVIEFALGAVERGMTECEPSLGETYDDM